MDASHPTRQLSFLVISQDIDMLAPELNKLMQTLAKSREWVIAAPEMFEVGGAKENLRDTAVEGDSYSLGGYMDIYSAIGKKPSLEVDRQQLEDVIALIHLLERFSIKHGLVIEMYLDSEMIGEIVCGLQDDLLRVGLLDEWRNAVDDEAEESSSLS